MWLAQEADSETEIGVQEVWKGAHSGKLPLEGKGRCRIGQKEKLANDSASVPAKSMVSWEDRGPLYHYINQ